MSGTGSRGGDWEGSLRLALPSDGEMYEPTLAFLRACGIGVERSSSRRYTGSLDSVPGTVVLFQRASDIPGKVEEGSADLGVVGLDRFLESRREGGDTLAVMEDLRFGRCELVLGVPDTWLDVSTVADLADLAIEYRAQGRELRIATKFPRLVQQFLFSRGTYYLTLIPSSGTLEAAPAMGFADLIADLVATGTTMRENRLKPLEDGTVLVSQGCMVANKEALSREGGKLARTKAILERIEAHLRAQDYCTVTANVQGPSEEGVAAFIQGRRDLAGMEGPTISPVYSVRGERWFSVEVLVMKSKALEAVEHIRSIGGNGIRVTQPTYLFHQECQAYQRLLAALGKERVA